MNNPIAVVLNKEQITNILNGELIEIRKSISNVPQTKNVIGTKASIGDFYGKEKYTFMDIESKIPMNGFFTCPFTDDGKDPSGERDVNHEYQLWVKEDWRIGAWDGEEATFTIEYLASPDLIQSPLAYKGDKDEFNALYQECIQDCVEANARKSDYGYVWDVGCSPCRIRDAKDMPQWASRLLLDIIDIRIETTGNTETKIEAEWVITVKQNSRKPAVV